MEKIIINLILTGFVAGFICRVISEKIKYFKEIISFLTAVFYFLFSIYLYLNHIYFGSDIFLIDSLSSFIFIFLSLFTLLIVIYSFSYMKDKEFSNRYYAYILWTVASSIGVIFSNNLILLSVFWGFLAIPLYLLLNISGDINSYPAKKTMIIVGGSDSLLIFGICGLIFLTGKYNITDMKILITNGLEAGIFLSLIVSALAKAGCMPFHTWVPEIAENSYSTVLAYLPASLDKLLGIYLFSRITLNIFFFHPTLWFWLRFIGAFTIVFAVFMAIVQHNIKKLLSYHAVSQVGYMVLGISTGVPSGIVGGLFHMLNNSIYKSLLFLGQGAVEKQTGENELENLGGIGKYMPVTFTSFLIGSLAISGVPPFNGFFSKWLIYQGLFEGAKTGDFSWNIWIICAMIGSALTLASFLKIVHSVFLGNLKEYKKEIKEVSVSMVFPMVVLSLLCIILGFGFIYPVEVFEIATGKIISSEIGFLIPSLSLVFVALIIGFLMFIIFSSIKGRTVSRFVGGEKETIHMEMSGTEFYKTIEENSFFSKMYAGARKKIFDIYDVGRRIIFYFGEGIRTTHTGVLPTYLTWIFVGCILLLVIFMKF